MKLGKKLMVVAMAVATFSMVGCALNQDGEGAINGKSVDFKNTYVMVRDDDNSQIKYADNLNDTKYGWTTSKNTKYYYRGIKQLATKHYDSICTITITPNDFKSNEMKHEASKNSNGVVGFFVGGEEITNWNNTSNGALNCILIGVRYNTSNKRIESYVSKYGNVSFSDLNYTDKENLVDINGNIVKDYSELTEEEKSANVVAFEKDFTSNWTTKYADADTFKVGNDYKVVIKATANDDGGYLIKYFTADDLDDKGKIKEASKAKFEVTVSGGKELDKSGYTERTQTNLGWYANIYPGQHLTASWKFTDTNGNVIPVPAAELD